MNRERALKAVLVLFGVIFMAGVYPLVMFMQSAPALAMMLSVYATLGIFLLLAARNPAANRSLIAFTAWSSFAHGGLMAVQAWQKMIPRIELGGVTLMGIVWLVLVALAPAKESKDRTTAAAA